MGLMKTSIGCIIGIMGIVGCGLSSPPVPPPDRPSVMQTESEPQVSSPALMETSDGPATQPVVSVPTPASAPTLSPDLSEPLADNSVNRSPDQPPAQTDPIPSAKPIDSPETAPPSISTESSKPAESTQTPNEPSRSPAEKSTNPAPSDSPSSRPPSPPTETPVPEPKPSDLAELEELARKADEEAIAKLHPFYARYADLLKLYVDDNGNVDYGTLRRKRGDLLETTRMLDELDPQEVLFWTQEEKIALWLNAHNLFTIKLIVDNYPIKTSVWGMWYPPNSIMQISGARDKTYFKMMGLEYTLREIERDILLKRFEDPRICFALSYASMGGAFLRREPYYPHRLDSQLDEQAQRFLQSPRGVVLDRANGILYLSDIFVWYRDILIAKYGQIKKFRDRPDDIRSYLNCILLYLKPEDARFLETISPAVKFIRYDWQLNEK